MLVGIAVDIKPLEIFRSKRKLKMRNFFTASGKVAFSAVAALLLTVPAFSQLSLRKALDTDADNKADYSVFRPSNNTWYINKSGGGITAQQFGIANEDFMTPGDYDGDGKGDISVWRDTNGAWYRINSGNNTVSVVPFGITGDEPVARDYDGDGKTDVAVVRRSNGAMFWYILRSLDGAVVGGSFGLSTDFTAPGDYDGDLKFDLAVQRPGATPASQGIFYIQGSLTGFQAVPWGLSNDLVVPGDYDGDGKTDVAVVREGTTPTSNLSWFIRKSSDGSFLGNTFGVTSTDLNVQNDYDGDGKTDIAVWRNSNGFFYVSSSLNGGSLIATPWGTASDFPIASYDTH